MYTEDAKIMSFVASGDMRTCLNRVVSLLAVNFKVGLGAANTGYGILNNQPNDAEHASVVVAGVTMGHVGSGGVVAGDLLSNAGSGWLTKAAVTAGLQHVVATAITTAASGMLASVNVERFYLPNSVA
jgi:predicted carbohydrate-binding protein with CBM5 and CBM33 domain